MKKAIAKLETVQQAFSASDARRLLKEEQEKRTAACREDLQILLLKYQCELQPRVSVFGQRLESAIAIVALDLTDVPAKPD